MMTAFRIALLLSMLGVSAYGRAMAAEPDQWKLQPLKYNHPGLQVDLGVGLWAWPLPMDYDDDGDLDLLVSCPDKPSNGVYYFENPTQDPSVKMPVFKAGVRLGPTKTNTQVSYVDGQPRLLVENNELTAFRDGDFSTQRSIYPDASFHVGKTRARMWRYVDWEGDGDQDLIVGIGDWSDYVWDQAFDAQGRWQNGPLHGYVYLIERISGDDYARPRKITAGGSPIDVFGWPSPNFADFDGDGDLDLICGEFLDGFTYFENVGSRSQPSYAVGVMLNGDDGQPLVMHLQMITPTAIDWDRDGDVDLIVGDEDGRVALVENVASGQTGTPVFRQPVYFQQEADTLKFGALATPFAHDWDGDGDEDILCGNTAGNIALFENLDGKGQRWSAPELLQVDGKVFRIMAGPNGSIQGPAEAKWGYTTLSVADWNGDGADDILVNSIWPRLTLLRGTKNGLTEQPLPFWNREPPPRFYWWNQPAENQQSQWRTTPLATDWDQDGQLDLVILDQEGYLTCQSRATDQTRVFVDEDGKPVRMNAKSAGGSGRIKLALVDWDGDGRQDILANSENAVWWRNCEERDGKAVLKRIGNLAKRNVAGHTSSPAVCDFDGNGKPDLLVGAENGRIYFIRHEDCTQFPTDQLVARKPKPADTPRFPGWVDDEFIYTNAPFPQCHASTICETNRGLVAAWFGGTREKHPDVGIWSSYHDGNQWKRPVEVANGIQHDGLRYPCWNPVLFQPPGDAPLMLFFKVGPNARDWWGEVMFSYDGGRSFRDRRRLPETIDGPVRSKPMLLGDGTLLCPSSSEHDDDWRMHYEILSDLRHPELGTSWRRIEPENQPFQVIQPSFLTHSDGRIQALMRSKHSKIFQAVTTDSGNTWNAMTELGLPNPNSGIEALTLADGRHLLLYNHAGGNRKDGWGSRQTLHLAISSNGIDWNKAAVVEHVDKGELSYPAMIQSRDGKVHVTYTWMRKRVKHLVIDPDGLETGAELGLDPWEAN